MSGLRWKRRGKGKGRVDETGVEGLVLAGGCGGFGLIESAFGGICTDGIPGHCMDLALILDVLKGFRDVCWKNCLM